MVAGVSPADFVVIVMVPTCIPPSGLERKEKPFAPNITKSALSRCEVFL
jgi:hypothetical protein